MFVFVEYLALWNKWPLVKNVFVEFLVIYFQRYSTIECWYPGSGVVLDCIDS